MAGLLSNAESINITSGNLRTCEHDNCKGREISWQKVQVVEPNRHAFKSWLSRSLAVWLWTGQLTSLCPSCLLQTLKSWQTLKFLSSLLSFLSSFLSSTWVNYCAKYQQWPWKAISEVTWWGVIQWTSQQENKGDNFRWRLMLLSDGDTG